MSEKLPKRFTAKDYARVYRYTPSYARQKLKKMVDTGEATVEQEVRGGTSGQGYRKTSVTKMRYAENVYELIED